MVIQFLILFILHWVQASYFYRNSSIDNLPHITSLAISGSTNQYIIMGTKSNQTVQLQIYTQNLTDYNYVYSKHKSILFNNSNEINVLFLSKDNQIVLVGTHNDKIRFYLLDDGELEEKTGIDGWQGDQNDIYLSNDDNFLAIGNRNNTISIYQNKSSQTVQKPIDLDDEKLNSPFPLGKPAENKTKQTLPTKIDLPLNFEFIQTITSKSNPSSLLFSHNSSKLYVGYQNKSLVMYNLIDYKYYFQFQEILNDDYITAMRLSGFGEVLVTGSKRGIIRVYVGNSQGDKLILNQKMYEPKAEVLSIRLTQDGLMILVTTYDQVTFVYVREGKGQYFNYDPDKSDTFRKEDDKIVEGGTKGNQTETVANNATPETSQAENQNVSLPDQINTSPDSTQTPLVSGETPPTLPPSPSFPLTPSLPPPPTLPSLPSIPFLPEQVNTTARLLLQNSTNLPAQMTNTSSTKQDTSQMRVVPTYLSRDDALFIQAEDNNSLIIYVACERTLTNCEYCKDNQICLSCIPDFYLSFNRCRRCDQGCRRCKGETCYNCQSGYYLNVPLAKCISCNQTLTKCQVCANQNECSRCSKGFVLKDRKCILKPENTTSTPVKTGPPKIPLPEQPRQQVSDQNQTMEQSRLLVVFIIICIVFVILLVVVGFLIFYINKLAKQTGLQSESNLDLGGVPRVVNTERRIASQPVE